MKVWFITGASRGLGRAFAEAALKRGDQVAATARDTGPLQQLVETYGDAVLPLRLDVTDKAAANTAVDRAQSVFQRLDVVVNNAGYALLGAIEETGEDEARAQLETRTSIARVAPIDEYAQSLAERLEAMSDEFDGKQPGDPHRAAAALLEIVDAQNPPMRLLMGNGAYDFATDQYRDRLAEWAKWEQTSRATDFPSEGE